MHRDILGGMIDFLAKFRSCNTSSDSKRARIILIEDVLSLLQIYRPGSMVALTLPANEEFCFAFFTRHRPRIKVPTGHALVLVDRFALGQLVYAKDPFCYSEPAPVFPINI